MGVNEGVAPLVVQSEDPSPRLPETVTVDDRVVVHALLLVAQTGRNLDPHMAQKQWGNVSRAEVLGNRNPIQDLPLVGPEEAGDMLKSVSSPTLHTFL